MKSQSSLDLGVLRHSTAHVMAAAVYGLFDDVGLDIGPATDDGFYYDFDLSHRLTPEDFERIEDEMRRIVDADVPFERIEMDREAAEKLLEDLHQPYKRKRLADIPEGEVITFYRCGDFIDLCRGPHLESTGKVRAFKIMSVAGSYFRGSETNPMLQRLYGIAETNPKQIKVRLKRIEEARKRDHRRIGQELDLFSIHEDVGPGLVHWHPKGARIRSLIEDFWRAEHFKNGYELLYTPHVGRATLWETSGHLGFYSESMFAPMDIDGNEYFIKPMNCPFHIKVYQNQRRSYRELPLRWAELGTVYRYEKAGVLHGLMRVRGFTQDDAHIICTPEQIEAEVTEVISFARRMWHQFGFPEIKAFLSTRPEKSVGDDAIWEQATESLRKALETAGIPYETDVGGGAFYGPKIDLKINDAIGREWQMSTIQFDFNLPERFDMTYIGEDGEKHRPYMVHRALLGSIERFFGVLIEHYAGAFPVWLAPEQVRVLPLTDDQHEYASEVATQLKAVELRVTVDARNEKIGAKIRQAQLNKIPYMLILGPKEAESGKISVRSRTEGDQGVVDLESFVVALKKEEAAKGELE